MVCVKRWRCVESDGGKPTACNRARVNGRRDEDEDGDEIQGSRSGLKALYWAKKLVF